MFKAQAIELLGGDVGTAARAMGVTYQAVKKWPDKLPPRIEQRVHGVLSLRKPQRKPRTTASV